MGLVVARNPVLGVSEQVRHKAGNWAVQSQKMVKRLEISDLGSRGIVVCTSIYIVKTNALISCTVTMHLICPFVFAYAKRKFSHDPAHILPNLTISASLNC